MKVCSVFYPFLPNGPNQPLDHWVECSLMVQETGIQSLVKSYQRLKKWYLISPCLTLSIIRYVSRVKWSNPRKGVAPFPTARCSSYWKGNLHVTLDYGRQLDFFLLPNSQLLTPLNMFFLWPTIGSRRAPGPAQQHNHHCPRLQLISSIHTDMVTIICICIIAPKYVHPGTEELIVSHCLEVPWCNGYRRKKWTRRHEFKSWTRLVAFHIALIPLGKVWIQ